jgi:hypothetical protein
MSPLTYHWSIPHHEATVPFRRPKVNSHLTRISGGRTLDFMLAMVAMIRGRSVVGNAPRSHRGVAGSTPAGSTRMKRVAAATIFDNLNAALAQKAERSVEGRRVGGSIPSGGTVRWMVPCFPWPALSGRAGIVQLAEQRFRKPQVGGSMPSAGPADLLKETVGTTTNGSVLERLKRPGRNPGSRVRNTPGSNPGRPTSLTAGGSYCERVAEWLMAPGLNPGGRKIREFESRRLFGRVAEWSKAAAR